MAFDPATAGIQAAGQVASAAVSSTINGLFQNKVYKAQADAINLQSRLSELSDSENIALAQKLQNAQTQQEQMQILTDAVSQIDIAGLQSNATILAAAAGRQSQGSTIGSTGITTNEILIVILGIAALATVAYLLKD